ncbi:M013L [Myxoma virus]|nr:M013L [Myxoma virus]WNN26894.1 M013L [Myxoma virus]
MEHRGVIITVLENLTDYQFKMFVYLTTEELQIGRVEKEKIDRIDTAYKISEHYPGTDYIRFMKSVVALIPNKVYVDSVLARAEAAAEERTANDPFKTPKKQRPKGRVVKVLF